MKAGAAYALVAVGSEEGQRPSRKPATKMKAPATQARRRLGFGLTGPIAKPAGLYHARVAIHAHPPLAWVYVDGVATGPGQGIDFEVRLAAFKFLEEHTRLHGEAFTFATLQRGFEFRGQVVKLIGPQGIFKPKILSDYPLSITTVAPKQGQPRPYDDGIQPDGTVIYKYRGTNPAHPDNERLRRAQRDRIPLIYFHATVPARYIAAWPVYVIGDDPKTLSFHVDVDGKRPDQAVEDYVAEEPEIARRYSRQTTRQRLHQQTFRDRVLKAYRDHCAVCRLRHRDLLDAAHIIPDADPLGEPRVQNGLSLCKLHHAAFDQRLFGIRPDLIIQVRPAILEEEDGPMLQHGLQEIHGSRLYAPRRAEWRPDGEALERRFAEFERGLG